MLTSANNLNTSSTSNSSLVTTKTAATKSDAEVSQDRFLKLLVAQLNNQDPMNPMDNAQMTSQMAQINTVSGIQQLNDTMKSMATQLESMQSMQSATLIGKPVLVKSNTLTVKDGSAAGAVSLDGEADKVTVQILSPGGQSLGTIELGAQAAGLHGFAWDASAYTGTGSPTFKVTATLGGKTVASTSLAADTVAGVGSKDGSITVELTGRSPVAYSDIQLVM